MFREMIKGIPIPLNASCLRVQPYNGSSKYCRFRFSASVLHTVRYYLRLNTVCKNKPNPDQTRSIVSKLPDFTNESPQCLL